MFGDQGRVPNLSQLVCCPRCRAVLTDAGSSRFICSDPACDLSQRFFPVVGGQAALVDFDDSIFDEEEMRSLPDGSVLPRDTEQRRLVTRLRKFLAGINPAAAGNCALFLTETKKISARPLVLVVGGASIGDGMEALYADKGIDIIGTDVFASPHTRLIADGHRLPFRDGVFDGVLIQAVLEHVLEPGRVVAEIERVLKPEGIVYADTPFMQQVHEGAFDFSRFTLSGHRWLFRRFGEISSGTACGAGTALIWSIRYFVRALSCNDRLAAIVAAPFFWLQYFDRLTDPRANADAASGVFFLGRKGGLPLQPKDMIGFYRRQTEMRGNV